MTDFGPAIARLRAIAAAPGDWPLIADGPPHPDAKLLDLCDAAVRHLKEAERAYGGAPPTLRKVLFDEIAKIQAKTGAGIYGKALVMRTSADGAPVVARGIFIDLLNCPALRASNWSPEG